MPPVLLRVAAERFTFGAGKYGDWNWVKGFPFSNVLHHMQSHLLKFRERRTRDENGEPEGDLENLGAIAWGCAVLGWYIEQGMSSLDDRRPALESAPVPEGPLLDDFKWASTLWMPCEDADCAHEHCHRSRRLRRWAGGMP